MQIHLCSMSATQRAQGYDQSLRSLLNHLGHTILARDDDPLLDKLAAASACDLCLLLLGSDFGDRDATSSFSHAELEFSAAVDQHSDKVLVFAQDVIEHPNSNEQQEFIERVRDFQQGRFQAATITNYAQLEHEVTRAIAIWRPPLPRRPAASYSASPDAVMVSSTGDAQMVVRRNVVREVLLNEGLSIIDYLHEPSESVTPIDRVLTWARECQLLIVILGQRYGYVSPVDGLGVTELEFVTALRAGRPILAFVGVDAESTGDLDQRQFLRRVCALLPEDHAVRFETIEQLKSSLRAQLARFRAGEVTSPGPDGYPGRTMDAEAVRTQYRRQLQRWLGVLPHLTQPTGMPLDSIFVSLQILPIERPGAADPHVMLVGDTEATRYSFQALQPVEADSALQRYSRLLLQGEPGSGKTVALRWYAVNAPVGVTPIFIRLAGYARALQDGRVSSLLDFLQAEENRLALMPRRDNSLWLDALRFGSARLLLDALDEVPAPLQARIASEIEDLARQVSPRARIVVTARLDTVIQLKAPFVRTRMQPLSDDQQRTLAEKWYHTAYQGQVAREANATSRAIELMTLLQQQSELAQWARNPLLLTYLAALMEGAGSAPQLTEDTVSSKAVLYRRILRLMLARWNVIALRPAGNHLWEKEQLLLRLAQGTALSGRGDVLSSADITHAWAQVCDALPPSAAWVPRSATQFTDEMADMDGILTRAGENLFSFAHITIAQYLAASLLTVVHQESRVRLVEERRLHAQWEEVTQFLVAELDRLQRHGEADHLVWTLIRADLRPIKPCQWRDPLHLSLLRAARCHGARASRVAAADLNTFLTRVWARIWLGGCTVPEEYVAVESAEQAFVALGESAATFIQTLCNFMLQNDSIGHFARRALGRLGAAARPAVDQLRETLRSPDATRRGAAALALGYLGYAATPALVDLCSLLDDPTITYDAGSLFSREISSGSVDRENKRMFNFAQSTPPPSPENPPKCAANALIQLQSVSGSVLNRLIEIYPHLNSYERRLVLEIVGSLWEDAVPALSLLRRAISDEDGEGQRKAVAAIGCLGPAAAPMAHDLLQLIRATLYGDEGKRGIHALAIWALSEMGDEANGILEEIRQGLYDTNVDVREDTLFLLEQLGPVKAPLLNDMRRTLNDREEHVRMAALAALATLGHLAGPALPDFQRAIRDGNPDVRARAATTIGAIGSDGAPALDDLIRALNDPAGKVQAAAIEALGAITQSLNEQGAQKQIQSALQNVLARSSGGIRGLALKALATTEHTGTRGDRDAIVALQDAEAQVRTQAARALGDAGAAVATSFHDIRLASRLQPVGDGLPSLDLNTLATRVETHIILPLASLRQASEDPDPEVRVAVAKALGKIGDAVIYLLRTLDRRNDIVLYLTVPATTATLDLIRARLSEALISIVNSLRPMLKQAVSTARAMTFASGTPDQGSQPLGLTFTISAPTSSDAAAAATALMSLGAAAAPALDELYQLLCAGQIDEHAYTGWAQGTVGRGSPLGQASAYSFVPPYLEEVRDTFVGLLSSIEDAGSTDDIAAYDGAMPLTQNVHDLSLGLTLFTFAGTW